MFLDPMFGGGYSEALLSTTAGLTDWSFVLPGDETDIAATLDSVGINYYNPATIRAHSGPGETFPGTDRAAHAETTAPRTVMDWPIVPSGLTDLLLRTQRDVGLPIRVTENGMAAPDLVVDGAVHDDDRIAYLHDHLDAVHAAIEQGADVRGVLRVDPARQLRVGLGLRQALRDRARGPVDAGAVPEGLRAVVRRRHRPQRTVSRRQRKSIRSSSSGSSVTLPPRRWRSTSSACRARSPGSSG